MLLIFIIFQAKPVTPKRVPNKNKKKPKEGQGIVTKDFICFQDCKIYLHICRFLDIKVTFLFLQKETVAPKKQDQTNSNKFPSLPTSSQTKSSTTKRAQNQVRYQMKSSSPSKLYGLQHKDGSIELLINF